MWVVYQKTSSYQKLEVPKFKWSKKSLEGQVASVWPFHRNIDISEQHCTARCACSERLEKTLNWTSGNYSSQTDFSQVSTVDVYQQIIVMKFPLLFKGLGLLEGVCIYVLQVILTAMYVISPGILFPHLTVVQIYNVASYWAMHDMIG